MEIRAEEISQILKDQIKNYEARVSVAETGTILSVGDGIARVYGLENAMAGELLEFPGGLMGMVLNLEEDNVGAYLWTGHRHQRRRLREAVWKDRFREGRRCHARSRGRWTRQPD